MNIEEKIKQKCQELRPRLQEDGGDLEFVQINLEKKTVHIRLHGACVGCPLSLVTLKNYVEKNLREVWPELKEVVPEG